MSFDKLIGSLPSDVQVEALRTVIVLTARRTFSFITVQTKRLLVGVFLDRCLDSSRVVKVTPSRHASSGRWSRFASPAM